MELYELILNTAVDLFQEQGLKFTVQDIAGRMHIAKKTIYHIYPSKEALLTAIVHYGFDQIQKGKQEILSRDMDLVEKLRTVMIAMPDSYQILDFRKLQELNRYPEVAEQVRIRLKSDWDPIIELIREGQQQGRLRNISIPVLRLMVTASIEEFLSSDMLRKENILYREALESMMDIIMKGIEV
ncbi:MAG: TetR/AcrR family transcriptional regulator [Solobacterium sp.]|nr:TetR/AcrR family transcriptional regulator [Solobacterium sp.]